MIRVETSGPEAQDNVGQKVLLERERAIKEWKETGTPPRRTDAYRDLKSFLTRVFAEKCGYCETLRSGGQKSIDHFRPTNEVTAERKPVSHPGYWWLAYEWFNLVPACEDCNEWNEKKVGDKPVKGGKKCEFRVSGHRIIEPSDDPSRWRNELESEDPLLLSPYEDDPQEHIEFDLLTFRPRHTTERGKETVEVCSLDRDDLLTARGRALARLISRTLEEGFKGMKEIDDVPASSEYSAFLNTWVRRCREKMALNDG